MNPYQFEVTCSVCGGAGMGTIQTSAASWYADTVISHTNPSVCAANLRYKREAMARKEKELELREKNLKEKEEQHG